MRLTAEELDKQRRIQEASVFPDKCRVDLLDTIEALTRERDTAHAAAIAAAAAECDRRDNLPSEIQRRILALTPADAQRSYNLRIAEAVRDESEWWFRNGNCGDSSDIEIKRQLANNAAVERLKGGPDAGEENAQAPPFAATSESGGA